MRVKELIEILREYDENDEIIIANFQRFGGDYAYKVGEVGKFEVAAYYGDDYEAVGIVLGGQLGGVNEKEEY